MDLNINRGIRVGFDNRIDRPSRAISGGLSTSSAERSLLPEGARPRRFAGSSTAPSPNNVMELANVQRVRLQSLERDLD